MDVNSIMTWVLIIVGIVAYWKKGGNDAANNANSSLLQVAQANKMQIDQLIDKVKGLEERERMHLGDIGRLKGQIDEKDKTISILRTVDVSKNPVIMKSIQDSEKREERILVVLEQLMPLMKKMEQHFDGEAPRV